MQNLEDLRPPELLAASSLVLVILGLGFYPAPLIELSAATISQLNGLIQIRVAKEP
jgi:NADH-quinone oxidoreductase subunit M